MPRHIRWNDAKAESNRRKHGITFYEAETIFDDPLLAIIDDVEHSAAEDRMLAIGVSRRGELVVVAYTVRNDEAWLIMARRPTPAERRRYMRGDQIRDRGVEKLNLEDFPEVDFTNAVRGRHDVKLRPGLRVSIDENIARHFRNDDAINDALRALIAEGASVSAGAAIVPAGNILRVSLDDDVARHYRTDEQVNQALRMLIEKGRAPEPREG